MGVDRYRRRRRVDHPVQGASVHRADTRVRLVKEYFGMSVGETFKTWSAMETIISVVSIVLILGLSVLV
jgi:H+/gluconate symporter-like permease